MKAQIIEKDGIKYKVIEIIEEPKTLKIPELKIEVETELRKPMTYIEAEKLCINKKRMLTIAEASYIFDNGLIKDFGKEREWIQHYSKRMRKAGFGCALDSDWDGGRLGLDGGYGDGSAGGSASGVRLVRDLK